MNSFILFYYYIFLLLPTEQSSSECCYIKTNFDCNYTFPIDSAPNKIPFGAKPIRKDVITIGIWFNLTRFWCLTSALCVASPVTGLFAIG